VNWDNTSSPTLGSWTLKSSYTSPELKTIIQEIVNDTNWTSGNALAIGDAAAYVEVETQGALMCGFQAGKAVLKELGLGK
jgi:hypothetical protein